MTTDDIERAVSLVDDICLVMSGWRQTEGEQEAYLQAHSRIAQRGYELKQVNEIKRLKARIQELEAKP